MKITHALAAGLMLITATSAARAEEASVAKEPRRNAAADEARATKESEGASVQPPSAGRRTLSAGAALVPGVVAHGAGHFALGEPRTARRLLYAELTGLGLIVAGGAPIFFSGASRYLVGPSAAAVGLGVGLFSVSFAADMYGTLSFDGGAAASRGRPPPWIETELGYRHVDDPLFDYEHFMLERVSMMSGPLRVTPSAMFSTAGENARYRIEGAYRLLGPIPSPRDEGVWNDHLDVVIGGVHHRYAPEGFTRSSAELAIDTRYDLGHVGSTLRGAFVEAAVGYARGRISYEIPGVQVSTDGDSLLLTRLAFGASLRGRSKPGSEIVFYYDHRHDDLAAGWVMPGLVSGVLGHLGGEARWFFTRNLGVSVMTERGSAFVTGFSVLFRQAATGSGEEGRGNE